MKRNLTLTVCFLALTVSQANGELIDFRISADDYAELWIDSVQVALVDAIPGGTSFATLDLSSGQHDISINFENRQGSSWLNLYWKSPSDPSFSVVPKFNLFSNDASGNTINGLRAEYSTGLTIYGEGPIDHNWNNRYEGGNAQWGGFVGVSTRFEETLTGQIPVPEPSTSGICVMALLSFLAMRRTSPYGHFRS